jgi:beta-lactam-binding protein with PASTA domain
MDLMQRFVYFFPFLFFIFGYFIAYSFFHTKGVIVPNIVGKPIREAIKIVSKAGLNVRFFRDKENIDVEPGVILEQSPKFGMLVKPNNHIFVTVAKHERRVHAPHLFGKKYTLLCEKVKGRILRPTVFWLKHSYPKDFCMAQSPLPGQEIREREFIAYCSLGRNSLVIIPDLRGQFISDAKAALEKEGVNVEIFCKRGLNTKSRVTAQKPVPGKIVDKSRRLYVQLQSE